MFTRAKYQNGSLTREARKAGAAVWVFRWREYDTNARRKVIVGTVTQFPTKSQAMKAVESQGLRRTINRDTRSPRTVAELVTHYQEKELPDGSSKAFSTRAGYQSYLKNWIVPVWGKHSLSDVRTVSVEEWLGTLSLSNGSRAKIRNLMSTLFSHAMRYEWIDRNPIALVRQSAKRERVPDVLDVSELSALLAELKDPCRTAVFLAAVTGLRVSELLALKWEDIRFESREISLRRAIVHQHVGLLKTEASNKPLPMDASLAEMLFDWRGRCAYNQPQDWIFASLEKHGQQPYWPENMLRRHIRPAAKRAGIKAHIGWHSFRRTLATLLQSNGEAVKVTQELLRHASSKLTMDVYAQAQTPEKRAAQSRVVEMIARGNKKLDPCGPTRESVTLASD
jgi:integrase